MAMADGQPGSRMADLTTSVAAVLVAEGCNLGFAPVVKPGHPALTRARLSHVSQNYLRAETLAAANARLITAQGAIDVAICGVADRSPPWTGCGSSCPYGPWTRDPTRTTSASTAAIVLDEGE